LKQPGIGLPGLPADRFDGGSSICKEKFVYSRSLTPGQSPGHSPGHADGDALAHEYKFRKNNVKVQGKNTD